MKIDKEKYNRAVSCLKRYNYNCINIMNIQADIMSISSPNIKGLPKAPYSISDIVLDSVVKLQEDKDLQKSLLEYKVVLQALQLVDNITRDIFEEQYQKRRRK